MKKIFFSLSVVILFCFILIPPVFAATGLINCGNEGQAPCTFADLENTIARVFNFILLYIAAPVTVAMIVFGGVKMIISGGNKSTFDQGKKIITSAAIGLVIVFGAWLIVNTVLSFLKIGQ